MDGQPTGPDSKTVPRKSGPKRASFQSPDALQRKPPVDTWLVRSEGPLARSAQGQDVDQEFPGSPSSRSQPDSPPSATVSEEAPAAEGIPAHDHILEAAELSQSEMSVHSLTEIPHSTKAPHSAPSSDAASLSEDASASALLANKKRTEAYSHRSSPASRENEHEASDVGTLKERPHMPFSPGSRQDARVTGERKTTEAKRAAPPGGLAPGQVMGKVINRTLQQPGTSSSSRRQLSNREAKTTSHVLVLTFWSGSCVASLGVSLLLLFAVSFIRRKPSPGHEVCRSHACNEFSRRLRASINDSVSPCDSLTHFVCDGWHRANKLSVREASFKVVLGRISRLAAMVSEDSCSDHARGSAFFGSCRDVFTGRSDETAAVRAALHEARIVWPRRHREPIDALHTILYSSLKLHWSPLLHVELSEVDGKTHVLLTPVHAFAIPLEKALELRGHITAKRQYLDLLREEIGGMPAQVDGSVSLEETLYVEELLLLPLRDPFLTPDGRDFIETSTLYLHDRNLSEARWKEALSAFGGNISREVIFWTENIRFVVQFFNLWLEHGEWDIFLLISWCTVQLAALYANRRLIINYYGFKERAAILHGAFCLGKTYLILGSTAFSGYRTDIHFPGSRGSVEIMAIAVREAFLRRLTRWRFYDENQTVVADWNSTTDVFSIIDAAYSAKPALESHRLPNMAASFVRNWRTLAVPYSLYGSNAAYAAIQRLELHVRLQNDFALLPHAFSFPLYAVDGIPAVNIAGVGSEMALAMSELVLDAYSGETFGKFKECLGMADPASSLLAFLTLDVLAELFEGSWMSEGKRLVGFEVYSPLQLFFMAACFARCGRPSKGRSTDEDYCDVAVRHVDAFTRAFDCSLGSPMNPERKCSL